MWDTWCESTSSPDMPARCGGSAGMLLGSPVGNTSSWCPRPLLRRKPLFRDVSFNRVASGGESSWQVETVGLMTALCWPEHPHTQKERLTDPKSSSPTQRGCPRLSFLPPLTSLCTDKSQSWRQRLLTHPDEAHWSWRLEVKQQLTLRHLLFLSPSERYTLLHSFTLN